MRASRSTTAALLERGSLRDGLRVLAFYCPAKVQHPLPGVLPDSVTLVSLPVPPRPVQRGPGRRQHTGERALALAALLPQRETEGCEGHLPGRHPGAVLAAEAQDGGSKAGRRLEESSEESGVDETNEEWRSEEEKEEEEAKRLQCL